MRSATAHYDFDELIARIADVGIAPGDTVFTHVGMGMIGYPKEGRSMQAACKVIQEAFRTVLGSSGTWVIPTYTYSYCKNEVYDSEETPSVVGDFTNYFRKLEGVSRSRDPIFSVAAAGAHSKNLIVDLPPDCFGSDSVYARLTKVGAKICNVGVGFRYATYIHYVEQMRGVPYRFPKLFSGQSRIGGQLFSETWLYNVRPLIDNCDADLRRLERDVRKAGKLKAAPIGLGEITCARCEDIMTLALEGIERDPWYLAQGPAIDLTGLKK